MKLFGTRNFYKHVLAVAMPIMIQNAITNSVSLLDNIMVGQLGKEQMAGVAIVNQLIFVFNLTIFGAISGAGIFGAQFYGKGDYKGMRDTFRFKILTCFAITILGALIFYFKGDQLIRLFLNDSSVNGSIEATFSFAKDYLIIMLFTLLPFALSQSYASTLREMSRTVVPMTAGIVAVFTNLVLNYILIFGKFGFPALGVTGAAIATVLSKILECGIIVLWTHIKQEIHPFIKQAYRSFRLPAKLSKQIIINGAPLLVNEALWAGGMSIMVQCYSTRGLDVVAGYNISSTVANLFNIVFITMGTAISILIGPMLGAGDMKRAKEADAQMITFSVLLSIGVGICLAAASPFIPMLYKVEPETRHLATAFILVASCCMPLFAFTHAAYFTLRSGGRTIITFLFDSVFVWTVCIPLAFSLSRFTALAIIPLYIICQLPELIKCIVGFSLIKKGVWLNNIVDGVGSDAA